MLMLTHTGDDVELLPTAATSKPFSTWKSCSLLLGRLLIASLFIAVGWYELATLLYSPLTTYCDAHDTLWPKVVQLGLGVPFALGFQVHVVSCMLTCSLL